MEVIEVLKLDHFYRLTDSIGILQHSCYSVPDRRHGYTSDDNARALIAASMLLKHTDDPITKFRLTEMAHIYMSFLLYAQHPEGYWLNFMDYNKNFTDKTISQDCYGRCMLASAQAIRASIHGISNVGTEMFVKGMNYIDKLDSPRGIAYTLLALCSVSATSMEDSLLKQHIYGLAKRLHQLYDTYRTKSWHWFENGLFYCNGILPHAILASYEVTGDQKMLNIGLESLDFLITVLIPNGYLDIVGNDNWSYKDKPRAIYDQQCIDAASLLWACKQAYDITGSNNYLEAGQLCWQWFWGKNRAGLSLYDAQTGGCYDGLTPHGINKNEGAESLIALLLSYIGARELRMQVPAIDKGIAA